MIIWQDLFRLFITSHGCLSYLAEETEGLSNSLMYSGPNAGGKRNTIIASLRKEVLVEV